MRSRNLVTGYLAGEPRSEAQLRNLDVDDVRCAPVGDRSVAASQDDDLIRVGPVLAGQLPELEAAQSPLAAVIARTFQVPGLRRKLRPFLVVIMVVRQDRVAKGLGSISGHRVEFAGDRDAMLGLKRFCRGFGLETELAVDTADLLNVLLQQKILPALDFERNVVAAALEEEWHCRLPCLSFATRRRSCMKRPCTSTTAMLAPAFERLAIVVQIVERSEVRRSSGRHGYRLHFYITRLSACSKCKTVLMEANKVDP